MPVPPRRRGNVPNESRPLAFPVPAERALGAASNKFLVCEPPSTRTPPTFSFEYRRPILFEPPKLSGGALDDLTMGGIAFTGKRDSATNVPAVSGPSIDAFIALDATFAQIWNLQQLTIGDLSSTMALAPRETITLEFEESQRKVLEESTLDSTEGISSTESVTADKEAVNIARASSRTQNWHVDTTGTVTCGYASLSVTAGYSNSVTESNQEAISHIHDTTHKSAQTLKSLHKIEVKGTTEGVVQNRLTRTFSNPYDDRTLSINVFELIKHFSVQTSLDEMRYAVVLRIDNAYFDSQFVIRYTDFLRQELLDSSLVDDLPIALQGAQPPLSTDAIIGAIETATRALNYLFNPPPAHPVPNIFHVPPIGPLDVNDPGTSFDAQIFGGGGVSGLVDALANHFGMIYATLGFFHQLIQEQVPGPGGALVNILQKDDNAVRIATALATDIGARWNSEYADYAKDPAATDIKNIMDEGSATEIFRRVPGFLALAWIFRAVSNDGLMWLRCAAG